MILLFSDFGLEGPYTGQVKAVLCQTAPGVPVIDLFADAPAAQPKPAAYLLAAYGVWFPPGTVLLAVVDPGVGGSRAAVIVEAGGRWYVGPDNGLFELAARRSGSIRCWENRRASAGDIGELSRTRLVRAGGRPARPKRNARRFRSARQAQPAPRLAGRLGGDRVCRTATATR